MIKKLIIVSAAVALISTGAAFAQGSKRTPLQKAEYPDGYETITAIIEAPPGASTGRHTHPGIETGYVLEGELRMVLDGKPPQMLKAGDSYLVPAGAVHDAQTFGDKPVKVFGVFVVARGKPLADAAR